MNQLMSHRCGHKLDYLGNQTVINAHYERLDREAAQLGIEIEDVQVERHQNFSSFEKSLSSTAKAAYQEMVVRPPPNHWSWSQVDFAFNQTGLEPPPDPVEEKNAALDGGKKDTARSVEAESSRAEKWWEWLARGRRK